MILTTCQYWTFTWDDVIKRIYDTVDWIVFNYLSYVVMMLKFY